MAILDTILQQLNIWDGQLLLFIQNHLRSETLNPIVIAVTNLGNAGIFWIVLSVILLFPKKTRDRKSTRLNSSHSQQSRMPSSA